MIGIPKGYQLQVVSWENDGDNYQTRTVSGLTKEEVEFLIVFLNAITNSGYENEYHEYDKSFRDGMADAEEKIFDDILEHYENKEIPEKFKQMVEDKDADYSAYLTGNSECYFFRVYESHKVFYFPDDIEDVTEQFSKGK